MAQPGWLARALSIAGRFLPVARFPFLAVSGKDLLAPMPQLRCLLIEM